MNSPLHAEECFKSVLSMEKKIKEDRFLVPYAHVELAFLYKSKGNLEKVAYFLETAKYGRESCRCMITFTICHDSKTLMLLFITVEIVCNRNSVKKFTTSPSSRLHITDQLFHENQNPYSLFGKNYFTEIKTPNYSFLFENVIIRLQVLTYSQTVIVV